MTSANVLDHGYVTLIESWGSDERIIESARMSTQKSFLGWGQLRCSCGAVSDSANITVPGSGGFPTLFRDAANTRCPTERGGAHVALPDSKAGDEKLLRYLWTNGHATPFEMAGCTLEVQAPIFVFREWHRHRVPFGYSEMSARYAPLPDVNYLPSVERLVLNAGGSNRQAGTVAGSAALTEGNAELFRQRLIRSYADAQALYDSALADGVPKELARVHLPVGRYSRMRATGNLRGWLAFLTLRQAENAQWEIRQYANAVHDMLAPLFPRTLALFDEGRHA